MQNVFQVDAALLGANANGAGKSKGMAQTQPPAGPHGVGRDPASNTDANGRDAVAFEFQTVFEDLQTAPADTADTVLVDADTPAHPLAMLENMLRAFQSGEGDLEGLFEGNTDLAEQAKAFLSDLTDRLGAAGISDLNGRDLMSLVKDILQASPETFGALSGQLTALTAKTDRLAPPMVAPPVSRPHVALANGRGSDQMPAPIPGTVPATVSETVSAPDGMADMPGLAPNGRLQTNATASVAPVGPQIADPHITGSADQTRMQTPSDAVVAAKDQTVAPTTAVTPAGEAPLTALARDLDQTPKPLKADLEEARNAASQDRVIDLPRDGLAARTSPQTAGSTLPPLAVTALTAQTDPAMTGQAPTGAGVDIDTGSLDPSADLSARDGRSVGPMGTLGTPSQLSPSLLSPAQAQQVTRQIAYAIQNTQSRNIEITLNPAELGHVRISLSSAEAGMVVAIQADRPETLELMRRHADLLAGDFRDIGYDGTSFSFEQSGGQGTNPDNETPRSPPESLIDGRPLSVTTDLSDTTPPPTVLRVGDGGIDIRL